MEKWWTQSYCKWLEAEAEIPFSAPKPSSDWPERPQRASPGWLGAQASNHLRLNCSLVSILFPVVQEGFEGFMPLASCHCVGSASRRTPVSGRVAVLQVDYKKVQKLHM
jgi:hypothetical protein